MATADTVRDAALRLLPSHLITEQQEFNRERFLFSLQSEVLNPSALELAEIVEHA